MADCRRSCELSEGRQSATTHLESSSSTVNLNEASDGNQTFLKDHVRGVYAKWTTSLSQVSPKGHSGRSVLLPSIPEESEAHSDSSAIRKDNDKGQGNERKNFVVQVSENGSVATVNEELHKDLKTRFTCDNNEQVDTALDLNQTNNDSLSNDDNYEDFRKRRKLLVNRISSKNCRIKKIQRLKSMGQHVKNLEGHVETMKFQIKAHEHNQRFLKRENSLSKLKIAALEERSRLRALEVELKQDEVKRLRAQAECIQQQAMAVEQMQQVPITDFLVYQPPPELRNGTSTDERTQRNGPEGDIPDHHTPAITAALEEASC